MSEEHEKWIQEYLVPLLIENGKIKCKNEKENCSVLKKFEIRKLSLKEAFMLNICYKVKVILSSSLDNDVSNDEEFGLVVKVILFIVQQKTRFDTRICLIVLYNITQ